MKNRWMFQLVTGGIWATFTLVFMLLMDRFDGSLKERWNSGEIPIMAALLYIGGIFFFGWFMWWQKSKNEKKKLS